MSQTPLTTREVASRWFPLALSWLAMSLELPAISAVLSRLINPEIHLAAYGGVVFPIALILEAPVLMFLTASTALSKDSASYAFINRVMMYTGAAMTVFHALLVFTPLFDIVVVGLMDPPAEIIEPSRLGLALMLPWIWSIGYRRMQQGVLIRYNRSRFITIGTIGRLVITVLATALFGFGFQLSGVQAASLGISLAVLAEALYAGWAVRPLVREYLPREQPVSPPLTAKTFFPFYIPLIFTALISLAIQPLGSAAMARMPQALSSLAVWPVLSGLLFLFRAPALALTEIIVASLGRPNALAAIKQFIFLLASAIFGLTLVTAFTPLADAYFITLSGLPADLALLAGAGFIAALGWTPVEAFRNYLQGIVVHTGNTRSVGMSMIALLVVTVIILGIGIITQRFPALQVAVIAFTAGTFTQGVWLWFVSKTERARLHARPQ